MFFGATGIETLIDLDKFISVLCISCPSLDLRCKGILNFGGLKIESVRQKKYQMGKTFNAIAKASSEAKEVGTFVYDSQYSSAVSPQLFANCHVSTTGTFAGAPIMSHTLGCFVSLAVDKEIVIAVGKDQFEDVLQRFCISAHGVRGWFWEDSKYVYDGGRSVEWAYKNVPTLLEAGDLDNWQEKTATRLMF